MTKKSAQRLERDAQAASQQPPERGSMSLVLNSPTIPESVLELISSGVSEGALVTLFPIVKTYSVNMRPLEFGIALQLILNPHGQLMLRRVSNFDRKVEVEDSAPTVLGDIAEFPEIWREAFEESWERLAGNSD